MKKVMITLIVFLFLGGAFFGYTTFQKALSDKEASLNKIDVSKTYSQDITDTAFAKKNAKPATPQEIARKALLNSSGLGSTKNSYSTLGINEDDGVFIKAGILRGNGIPYSSTLETDGETSSLTNFDSKNQSYWQSVKQSDYDKIKNKEEQTVNTLNTSNEQQKLMEEIVKKAQNEAKK